MTSFDFSIESKEGKARAGRLEVNGREARTPLFMPVATKGCVKTLVSEDLEDLGVEAVISNMYHLLMKPGVETIERAGGLHDFMNWDGVIFTDSGGFQMIRKGFDDELDSEAVEFRSKDDGQTYRITPSECIEVQKRLGSDVAMCLDHCPPYPAERDEIVESLERTKDWAEECRESHPDMNIFGISQGGTSPDLRERSCDDISELNFQGNAIGGLSIGEPTEKMYEMVEVSDRVYQEDKPRYFMGLGSPVDLLECIERGVDIFDSAYPTRNARHKSVFTSQGQIRLDKSDYKDDYTPLDPECDCPICRNYSKAYIRHLCKSDELSWMRMTTVHNLYFIIELLKGAREAILNNGFEGFKEQFIDRYQ